MDGQKSWSNNIYCALNAMHADRKTAIFQDNPGKLVSGLLSGFHWS